jgi:hypothetical protein
MVMIQGKPRRILLAVLFAFLLTSCLHRAVAHAQMIPTPEVCKNTGPGDFEWWINLCFNYPTATPYRQFLVRF